MYWNFVNTRFSRHERRSSMTGLTIGCIKARDEISEVVVVFFFLFFFSSSSSCSCSSSSGEDKTFRTRLLDTFVLVYTLVLSLAKGWPSSIWCWGASSGTCTGKQNGAVSCRAREEGASTIHVHMQAEWHFTCSSFPNSGSRTCQPSSS